LWIVKQQNLRPQKRQVYANRDPRAADQSSIFTLKSWVAQGFIDIQNSDHLESAPHHLSANRSVSRLTLFQRRIGFKADFLSLKFAAVQQAKRHRNVGQLRHFDDSESAAHS
jgi:hypothetical protein